MREVLSKHDSGFRACVDSCTIPQANPGSVRANHILNVLEQLLDCLCSSPVRGTARHTDVLWQWPCWQRLGSPSFENELAQGWIDQRCVLFQDCGRSKCECALTLVAWVVGGWLAAA
eukprot:352947-Amphidinium_carterae.1